MILYRIGIRVMKGGLKQTGLFVQLPSAGLITTNVENAAVYYTEKAARKVVNDMQRGDLNNIIYIVETFYSKY